MSMQHTGGPVGHLCPLIFEITVYAYAVWHRAGPNFAWCSNYVKGKLLQGSPHPAVRWRASGWGGRGKFLWHTTYAHTVWPNDARVQCAVPNLRIRSYGRL